MSDLADSSDLAALHARAYAEGDKGNLREASRCFDALLQLKPNDPYHHYMRGLAHKYLRDWPTSLHHNQRAIALQDEKDESSLWNAGIAATALGDWQEARRLWKLCGIDVADGEGPIEDDFGVASMRLNAWGSGETVFARRIDVVRARLLNVPFPESGYRFGDIVLHDGASTGTRHDGDREVPVFNVLERLSQSPFNTFTAFVGCEEPEDAKALLDSSAPGIGFAEDWTSSVRIYCRRCSYGTPHRHASDKEAKQWQTDRDIGIAAQSRHSVDKLLKDWANGGKGRRIDSVVTREYDLPAPKDGHVWWRSLDESSD